MIFRATLIFSLWFLAACASRSVILLDPSAAAFGAVETIYVSTTRGLDDSGRPLNSRSEQQSYFRYEISVPPNREDGSIVTAKHEADPTTDFVATSAVIIPTTASFKSQLARALRQLPSDNREVLIYVHGFNNTFDESILRLAQLTHDFEFKGVSVAYSWPSAGHVLDYAYDRDSSLFARDGLEKLIKTVRSAGANNIILIGHSMGTLLAMETLRQIEIRDSNAASSIVNTVILISPDIDVEVFRTLARQIGKLPKNFYIFISQEDRLLKLSSFIAGTGSRVGNIADVNDLAEFKVQILDVSKFSSGSGHNLPGDSPALINMLNHLDSLSTLFNNSNTSLASAVVLSVSGATEIILSPITKTGR